MVTTGHIKENREVFASLESGGRYTWSFTDCSVSTGCGARIGTAFEVWSRELGEGLRAEAGACEAADDTAPLT